MTKAYCWRDKVTTHYRRCDQLCPQNLARDEESLEWLISCPYLGTKIYHFSGRRAVRKELISHEKSVARGLLNWCRSE